MTFTFFSHIIAELFEINVTRKASVKSLIHRMDISGVSDENIPQKLGFIPLRRGTMSLFSPMLYIIYCQDIKCSCVILSSTVIYSSITSLYITCTKSTMRKYREVSFAFSTTACISMIPQYTSKENICMNY